MRCYVTQPKPITHSSMIGKLRWQQNKAVVHPNRYRDFNRVSAMLKVVREMK